MEQNNRSNMLNIIKGGKKLLFNYPACVHKYSSDNYKKNPTYQNEGL